MAIKDEVLWTKIEPQTPVSPEVTPNPTQDQLKAKISTGDFTASEARQYNQMTWSNTWARDVALTSKDAMKNQDFQTAVTTQEVWMMKDAWIKQVNSDRITLDTTAPVTPVTPTPKVEAPVNPTSPVTPKVEAPVNPKPTNLWTIQGKKIISEAPEFKGADGQTYKTVRFDDGSLGTVRIWEWWVNELVWNTYKDEQRWDVKQLIEQGLNNADNIYKQISINWNIPEIVKNTKPYTSAKARYDIASKYLGYTEDQLYNAYINWEIWGQLEKDLVQNPYLSAAKEKYNKKLVTDGINQEATNSLDIYNKVNWKDWEVKGEKTALEILNEKFTNLFTSMGKTEDDMLSFKDYMQANYPDLVTQSQELNAKNTELKKLADQRDARLENIIKENPWISINRANMLAARQNKETNEQIKSMSYEIANLNANVQYMTNLADKQYSYEQEQQARQDRLEQEQRWYAFNMLQDEIGYQRTLEDRNYTEEQRQKDLEQQYDFTYWDINSEDTRIRDTAIRNAVAQLYTQYPIPGMEAPAVKEQKIKALMAQGLTGEQAISQLEQEIRSTNRYKQMITWTSDNKFGFQNIWDWTIAVTDPSTGQVTFESIQNVWTWITREQATSTYGSTPAVRNFNPWNIMDTWFWWQKVQWERFTRFNTPQEWFSALIAKIQNIQSGNSKVYSPNMTILEYISKYAPASDNNNPQAYANAIAKDLWVPVNSKIWELDPVKLASAHAKHEDRNSYKMLLDLWVITTEGSLWTPQATETGTQYSQEAKDWGDNIINWIWWTKITWIKDENLRSQVSSYIAEKTRKQPNQNIATIYWVLDVLKELETHPWLNSAVWAFWLWASYIPGTDARWFLAKLSQLEWKQFLEGIQQMKWMWALSNAEWQKIAAAASSLLDTSQSEADWKAELQKVKNLLEWKITTTEEDAWIKFDIYGRPLNNDDTSTQNTWTSTKNAYNASNGKTYKIVINP
jgi:uncharacterized protein YoaH (UPF0181 family)